MTALPVDRHITYQLQFRKCRNASCGTCRDGQGHGPYWYAYWRDGSRLRSAYIGKEKRIKKMAQNDNQAAMVTKDMGRKRSHVFHEKYGKDYYSRIGKKGGDALKEKRGLEHYRMISQKGGKATITKYGADHFSAMGKKGGNTTKERQDPDFYRRIGKMGGAAKRQKKKTKENENREII